MGIRRMGPCRVVIKDRGTGTLTIERTAGGVVWTEGEEKADITLDQEGIVPADKMSQGFRNEILVPIDAPTLDDLKFFPGIEIVEGSGGKRFIRRVSRVGLLDSDQLYELEIQQYVAGAPSADPEDHIIFPAVAPQVEGDKTFDASTQRAYPLRFAAYPDARRADKATWLMGDETATPV